MIMIPRNGLNYSVELNPVIDFPKDISLSPSVSADLDSASKVVIRYPNEEALRMLGSNRLTQSFKVLYYRFDGQEPRSLNLDSWIAS